MKQIIQPNKFFIPLLEAISKTWKAYHEPLKSILICRCVIFCYFKQCCPWHLLFNDVSTIPKLPRAFNMISINSWLQYLSLYSINFSRDLPYSIHDLKILNKNAYNNSQITCHFILILPCNPININLWIFYKTLHVL